jgi:pimeloyl-ACP methyl ester carboxylesterase
MATGDYQIFELENLTLQRGITLPRAEIAYKTYGRLADDKSNVILYPTSYGAQHHDTEWLIGPGRVLDTNDWFIVIPNMFGNGLSTSPSNLTAPFGPDRYPTFTHWDNVHAQRHLLDTVFGVERLALVYGWSMGAQQALHWGAVFPGQVDRICAVCGSARTSIHNKVFQRPLIAQGGMQCLHCERPFSKVIARPKRTFLQSHRRTLQGCTGQPREKPSPEGWARRQEQPHPNVLAKALPQNAADLAKFIHEPE